MASGGNAITTIATLLALSSNPTNLGLVATPGGGAMPIREPVGNTTSAAWAATAAPKKRAEKRMRENQRNRVMAVLRDRMPSPNDLGMRQSLGVALAVFRGVMRRAPWGFGKPATSRAAR